MSTRQIEYAVQDVKHLRPLKQAIDQQLQELGRQEWLVQETDRWLDDLEKTETEPQWRRVSGITSLSRAELAIVREVWLWRDSEARSRNRAPKRILPDDLLVAIARRRAADIPSLKAIRGLENRTAAGALRPISAAIRHALSLPADQHPRKMQRSRTVNLGLLGQFLTTAVNIRCKNAQIAPALVATSQDVRQLAAWKLGMLKLDAAPDLSKGWRAEIVGQTIEKILRGEICIRVGNPKSDQPLIIEPFGDGSNSSR